MPFIRRAPDGAIVALLAEEAEDAREFLAADHPEVRRFLGQEGQAFDALDADFIRVLEDLIDVLIAKNVLRMTDLPEEVQSKLLIRRQLRDTLPNSRLHILSDSDQGLI